MAPLGEPDGLPGRWRRPEPDQDGSLASPIVTPRGIWHPWRRPGVRKDGPEAFVTHYPRRWASPPELADWRLIDPVVIQRSKEDPWPLFRAPDGIDGTILEVREDADPVPAGSQDSPWVWHLFQDRACPLRGLIVIQTAKHWEIAPVRQRHMHEPADLSAWTERDAGVQLMREAREQQQRDLEEIMPITRRIARGQDASPSECAVRLARVLLEFAKILVGYRRMMVRGSFRKLRPGSGCERKPGLDYGLRQPRVAS